MYLYQNLTVFHVTYFTMKHRVYELEKFIRLKNLICKTLFVCRSQSKCTPSELITCDSTHSKPSGPFPPLSQQLSTGSSAQKISPRVCETDPRGNHKCSLKVRSPRGWSLSAQLAWLLKCTCNFKSAMCWLPSVYAQHEISSCLILIFSLSRVNIATEAPLSPLISGSRDLLFGLGD